MKLFLFIYLLIIDMCVSGQKQIVINRNNTKEKVDSSYIIYQKQIAELLTQRGLNRFEIDSVIELYSKNRITSNKNFAELLGTLYPSDKGIAIIVYFFQNDSLKRIFFEPGKVKESRAFHITQKGLLALNQNIIASLNLYKLSANRSPHLRGVEVGDSETPAYSFDSILNKATELLLPQGFDTSYKHLIIIPALNIGIIPFHLLRPYHNQSFLIENCSFTIAPSLLDVIALRAKLIMKFANTDMSRVLNEKQPFKKIFENVNHSTGSNWNGYFSYSFVKPSVFISNPTYPTNTKWIFPDLPGATREVNSAIKHTTSAILFAGERAIKDSILKYMNGSDLIYFATHGIADQEQPMQKSFLVLSGNSPFLTAQEIMDLRLKRHFEFPEMVILSACQTGLGKFMEAGVVGLARPFLIGGSNHVIMSLWNVDDDATSYLMSRFMYHLSKPALFMPSEQLRLAILDTKKKYPEPSKWASFSLFGIDY